MARRQPKQVKPATPLTAFASIEPGLEEALADELMDLGLSVTLLEGGVEFPATFETLCAVHLWSRLAARVTVRLGRFRTSNLEDLARQVRNIPWNQYVWPHQKLDVGVSSRSSRLRHQGSIERKIAFAIGDALRGPRLPGNRSPREAAKLVLRIVSNDATLSIDASGELLHRRGWKKATAKAPLRENLGAALLRLAEWEPKIPLVDPMCGSGTMPIEAACISLGIAAGAMRSFAYSQWPCFRGLSIPKPSDRPLDLVAPIVAADRDEGAIKATRANGQRARALSRITVLQSDFAHLEPPASRGLVVINPPFGERIGTRPKLIYRHVGQVLRRWSGWRFALLMPSPSLRNALGLPNEVLAKFPHGGLKVVAVTGEVP